MTAEGGALAAPGKLFLAGEYAVLERGEPALVAAIDRALHLEWRGLREPLVELAHRPSGAFLAGALAADPLRPVEWRGGVPQELRFAAQAASLSLRLCAEEGRAPRGFSAAFLDDLSTAPATGGPPLKLGLGGSAAASVLAVRAAAQAQGRLLAPGEALALALAAHWSAQGGGGSGGDVAASALGGVHQVAVRHGWSSPEALLAQPARALLAAPPLEARPVALPPDLRLLVVFSGASADTRALVAGVKAFAAARPARWRAQVAAISRATAALAAALEEAARDPGPAPRERALEAVRSGAAAMAALGSEAGVAIATPELARACALASSAGAAGKPSGAGGGDCAVVLAFGDEAAARAWARLSQAGLPVLRAAVAPAA